MVKMLRRFDGRCMVDLFGFFRKFMLVSIVDEINKFEYKNVGCWLIREMKFENINIY